MRGKEARKLCPDLQLVQVPTAHGKADLTLYRDSSKQVSQRQRNGAAALPIVPVKSSFSTEHDSKVCSYCQAALHRVAGGFGAAEIGSRVYAS